jgi:glycosyltransferase involved in cell wall biosynthesis
MRIVFLVERPTQFDAPFFRFAAGDPEHGFRVLFTSSEVADPIFDPELGQLVSWGIELLKGYDHDVCRLQGQSRWLEERLRPETCDLLITNGYRPRAHREAVRIAKKAGIATALRMDSVLWKDQPARNLAKRLRFIARVKGKYDLFLGAGTLTREYLEACGVPPERRGLFPYSVDVKWFQDNSDLTPEERSAVRRQWFDRVPLDHRIILSVAKFNRREAPRDLLRAFARLDRKDVWLLLAGAGPYAKELKQFADEHGRDRVRFLGYRPYPELPRLYAASDLFVHPAREEHWGVSVQEALACGRPVIASSRVGAAHDLINVGDNGFVYRLGDAEELARRIDSALALPPERVRERSREILARWDYAASWRHLLAAAARVVRPA